MIGQVLPDLRRMVDQVDAVCGSKHEPTLPIDCDTPGFRHSVVKTPAV
jgi:hypothetical protein